MLKDTLLPSNAEGDPLIYIDSDGNVLCNECAQKSIDDGYSDPEALQGNVYWEGETLYCGECTCALESVYGDSDL